MAVVQSGHCQNYSDIDVRKSFFNGIAALKHSYMGCQFFIEKSISLRAETHVGDRIAVMIVLPGGIDNYFRLKFVEDRQDDATQNIKKNFIGCVRRQRDIDCCSQSVRAAEVINKAGSRIKSPAILMKRYAQNIRIIPIYVLCAVSVMTISINDGNSFYTVGMTDVLNHHCFYVDT